MSDPYVIWTMRRTGGTTLATLLSTLSEHPGTQHEPFNPERKFGRIPKDFAAHGDADRLRLDLQSCLTPRVVIKHCYELMTPAFNAALLEVTTALGYRHIILDRKGEADRIISLELAQITGAWGGDAAREIYPAIEAGDVSLAPIDIPRAKHQMHLCHTHRCSLATLTQRIQSAPFVVYFEDIYSDPKAGRTLIERLLEFIRIKPQEHAAYEELLGNALLRGGQNSARILQAVPNAQAAIKVLRDMQDTLDQVFVTSRG